MPRLGDIVVENSIQQCCVETMGILKITKGRARLLAGDIRARGGIEVGELGSNYGREMTVMVGEI